jgi:ATP-binding cassette, subfamily B, bacterial
MNLPLRPYWTLLAEHIRPQKKRFALLVILMLGNMGLQVINPQIMRRFIDAALLGEAMQVLMAASLAFIGIALVQQVAAISVTYLGENVAWTATNALRSKLAWHSLNLDMDYLNDHPPGELIERIDGDVSELATFFSQFVVLVVGNLLLLLGILTALFLEDWRIGVVFSLFAAAAVWVLARLRSVAIRENKDQRQAEAQLYAFVEEQLSGTEDIRTSGAEGFSLRELFRLHGVILRSNRKAEFKSFLVRVVMGGLVTLGMLLAMGLGYQLFQEAVLTVGAVYLLIHYMTLLESPLWSLTHEVQSFQRIGACVERLNELLREQPKVKTDSADQDSSALPSSGSPELAFENVTFTYDSQEPVLHEVSFHLQPKRVLGLLGRTGSGKTTLARLVFRLYDPQQGRITLNGLDIRSLEVENLRQQVAIVTQDVQLFEASLRDNLTFFDSNLSDAQIRRAAAELGLDDWFASLPQGLDTRIESGGRGFSAGEAQLLAFTRVFLRNPGLVILDEASSRLDPATEQRIERAVDRLLQDRSAIIIAHRLGTVHRADDILILEQGRLAEWGPRRALAADESSRFHQLLQSGLEEALA